MPTIHDFGSFRINMYFADHNPPHVHVLAADFEALVSIADGKVIRGDMPVKVRAKALRWIAANRDMLASRWNELKD